MREFRLHDKMPSKMAPMTAIATASASALQTYGWAMPDTCCPSTATPGRHHLGMPPGGDFIGIRTAEATNQERATVALPGVEQQQVDLGAGSGTGRHAGANELRCVCPPCNSAPQDKNGPPPPSGAALICFDASVEFLKVKIEHVLQIPQSSDSMRRVRPHPTPSDANGPDALLVFVNPGRSRDGTFSRSIAINAFLALVGQIGILPMDRSMKGFARNAARISILAIYSGATALLSAYGAKAEFITLQLVPVV